MKKVFGIIITMVMATIMVISGAFADEANWEKAYTNMREYLYENDDIHKDDTAVNEVFYTSGTMDMDGVSNEFHDIPGSWNEKEKWFAEWYKGKLDEHYPEYKVISVSMEKITNFNGTELYNVIVIGENDMVTFEEGNQKIVDLIVVFY